MKATKMSQTVLCEKPDSAHRMASSGAAATRPSPAAAVIPRIPTTGPGSGSVISAAMTVANSAK
jgi:hypothetical protein